MLQDALWFALSLVWLCPLVAAIIFVLSHWGAAVGRIFRRPSAIARHPGRLAAPIEIRPHVCTALAAGQGIQIAGWAPSKQNEGPDQQARSKGPKPQGAG